MTVPHLDLGSILLGPIFSRVVSRTGGFDHWKEGRAEPSLGPAMSESNDVASATSVVSGAAISVATEAGPSAKYGDRREPNRREVGRFFLVFLAELWVISHRLRFSQRDWSRSRISEIQLF